MSQQLEICTFCSMVKQYVKGNTKMEKGLLADVNISIFQKSNEKKREKDFLRGCLNTQGIRPLNYGDDYLLSPYNSNLYRKAYPTHLNQIGPCRKKMNKIEKQLIFVIWSSKDLPPLRRCGKSEKYWFSAVSNGRGPIYNINTMFK